MRERQVLHHFGITVSDLDRSIDFYTKYFELAQTLSVPMEGEGISAANAVPGTKLTACFLVGDNTVLELIAFDTPKGRPNDLGSSDVGAAHPCFVVEDLDSLYQRMVDDGVEFNAPPQVLVFDTKMAFCVDPDGLSLELLEPGPELALSKVIADAEAAAS